MVRSSPFFVAIVVDDVEVTHRVSRNAPAPVFVPDFFHFLFVFFGVLLLRGVTSNECKYHTVTLR